MPWVPCHQDYLKHLEWATFKVGDDRSNKGISIILCLSKSSMVYSILRIHGFFDTIDSQDG